MESDDSLKGWLDFGFAFNDVSVWTIRLVIIPELTGPVDDITLADLVPKRKRKLLRVDDLQNSNFVFKWHGRVRSAACNSTNPERKLHFMDILKFVYTNTLSKSTPSTLLSVLMAADKYEVASCMKYCCQALQKIPMTSELALLYLDLPSTILMADTIQYLKDAAKEFLVARFKDISKFKKEMLTLPLVVIEAVLSSDDLEVLCEDDIYDFIMKWAKRSYTMPGEQQEILITRLLPLIRFPFLSRSKLEEVLNCTHINLKHRSKLVFNAISLETPYRQLPPVKEQERVYKL